MLSDEKFGLLGGEPEFIEDIRAAFPDLDRQVYGFLGRLRMLIEAIGENPADITTNKWLRPPPNYSSEPRLVDKYAVLNIKMGEQKIYKPSLARPHENPGKERASLYP